MLSHTVWLSGLLNITKKWLDKNTEMPSNKTIVDFLESEMKSRLAFQGCIKDI